jgi:hypothetical protein
MRGVRQSKTKVAGFAFVLSCLCACGGQSAGSPFANGAAGTAGTQAPGPSAGGTSGSSSGGKPGDAGASANHTGGTTAAGGGAAQTAGQSNGGTSAEGGTANGGSVSNAGQGANAGSNPSGSPWCPNSNACRYDADQRLAPSEPCPANRECYADDWCGQSIQCVKYVDDGTCTEKPSCDPEQVTLSVGCLRGGICETRSACGKSIVCETKHQGDAACNPGLFRHRVFAARAQSCSAISIYCPKGSILFSDECGCGCEQPETCPEGVNCQPSGEIHSELCDSTDCPFTGRAY